MVESEEITDIITVIQLEIIQATTILHTLPVRLHKTQTIKWTPSHQRMTISILIWRWRHLWTSTKTPLITWLPTATPYMWGPHPSAPPTVNSARVSASKMPTQHPWCTEATGMEAGVWKMPASIMCHLISWEVIDTVCRIIMPFTSIVPQVHFPWFLFMSKLKLNQGQAWQHMYKKKIIR